ncbi:MAG: NTP transferase domain-containing protein [Verrucomicrobia bacterium]|nr:NTP transferase domain-containing protein [Verrucomicrobiota bacterium]
MGGDVQKAVILAAGRGTRMGKITDSIPKPMVAVRGKPILQYIVEGLRTAGINQILIIVGYRKEVIRSHFKDGSEHGVKINYAEQMIQDGTGKVVELAHPFTASDAFLLSYGDILVDPAVYPFLRRLQDAEMLLTVRFSEDVSKGGAVYLNEQGEVTDLQEKQSSVASHWYNAGIYTFRPTIYSYISRLEPSPRGEYELTDAIRAVALDKKKIRALEIRGEWADVRDPQILAALNEDER